MSHSSPASRMIPASAQALAMLEERAQRLLAAWQNERAAELALTLLRLDSTRHGACLILAESAMRRQGWADALRWFLQAYALGRRDAWTMLRAAEAAILNHDLPRAQMMLQEVQRSAHLLDATLQAKLQSLWGRQGQLQMSL